MAVQHGRAPAISEHVRFSTVLFHESILDAGLDPGTSSLGGLFVYLMKDLEVAPAMSLVVRDNMADEHSSNQMLSPANALKT
jgi:hypothetical protein